MTPLVLAVLAASLLGSPHCAAMCGGFVCFYAGAGRAHRAGRRHVAYNAGRLVSYVLLGLARRDGSAQASTWPGAWPASSAAPPSPPAR